MVPLTTYLEYLASGETIVCQESVTCSIGRAGGDFVNLIIHDILAKITGGVRHCTRSKAKSVFADLGITSCSCNWRGRLVGLE